MVYIYSQEFKILRLQLTNQRKPTVVEKAKEQFNLIAFSCYFLHFPISKQQRQVKLKKALSEFRNAWYTLVTTENHWRIFANSLCLLQMKENWVKWWWYRQFTITVFPFDGVLIQHDRCNGIFFINLKKIITCKLADKNNYRTGQHLQPCVTKVLVWHPLGINSVEVERNE